MRRHRKCPWCRRGPARSSLWLAWPLMIHRLENKGHLSMVESTGTKNRRQAGPFVLC